MAVNCRGNAGFTLTEVMVVVVMIGILSALAYPYLGRDQRATETRDFSNEAGRALQIARSRAVAQRLPMRAHVYGDRIELRSWVAGINPGDAATAPALSVPPYTVVLARTGTEVLAVEPTSSPVPSSAVLSPTMSAQIDFNGQGQMQFVGQAPMTSAFIFVRSSILPVGVLNRLFRIDVRGLTGHIVVRNRWD